MPNQLMILACQGYARRDKHLTLNGGDEADAAWIALNRPELLDEKAQELGRKFNSEREQIFREYFQGPREKLQPPFKSRVNHNGVNRPPSFKALLRHYTQTDDLLYEFVNSIYERAVGETLRKFALHCLIHSNRLWRMFLLSYVFEAYRRAIKEHGFGKKNAGNLDLWSVVYLPCCETFVTHDKRQRRALKVINKGSVRPARILSYISGPRNSYMAGKSAEFTSREFLRSCTSQIASSFHRGSQAI